MEAVLVNASASLQLRDRIRCVPIDSSEFLGRRLVTGPARVQSCRWSSGALRTRQGSVTEAAVNQEELDKQRAAMREWWMAQLAAKNGAAKSTPKAPVDQKEMDKQRAAMREWWLAQLAAKTGGATAGSKAASKVVSSASQKVVAAKVEVSKSVEQETIEKELERERAKREGRQAEEKRVQQKVMDKSRKEMRDWWLAKLEVKKRALGLEPYEPCWLMVPDVGSIATESYELTGEGVIVGAVPQTSYDEKPVVIDVPVVSSNHAKVFGKDVVAGFGKYTREYFVRDLGSTNGTYLNKNRIRPKTDVKLRPGDTLRFADEKVTFIIKKGERS